MTRTARRVRAVRGHLVRLVAVLAVLAGVGLAVGLQCTDGMAAISMSTASASMECAPVMGEPDGHQLNDPCTTVHVPDASGAGGLGGVLTTCLAFIVAVVAVAMALRPIRLHSVARMLRSVRAVVIHAVLPRGPSLAELCLLRT